MQVNLTVSSKHFNRRNKYSWLPYSCASGIIPTKTTLTDENIYMEGCHVVMSNIINYATVSFVSLHSSIIILLVNQRLYNFFCFENGLIAQVVIVITKHYAFSYKRIYAHDFHPISFENNSRESHVTSLILTVF